MKTSSVKIYIAEDGERFNDREECLAYEENYYKVMDLQEKYLHPLPENKVVEEQFKAGLCYIQHDPVKFNQYRDHLSDEILLQYILAYFSGEVFISDNDKRKSLMEMKEDLDMYDRFKQMIMDFDFDYDFMATSDSLMYISTYLDRRIEKPFFHAWKRITNTDHEYREWYDTDLFYKEKDITPIALNR